MKLLWLLYVLTFLDGQSSVDAVTVADVIIVAAFLINLFVSVKESGWHGTYLLFARSGR
jgi:hypothetical protein